MIQITPQMRLLLAVEPVDFRQQHGAIVPRVGVARAQFQCPRICGQRFGVAGLRFERVAVVRPDLGIRRPRPLPNPNSTEKMETTSERK